MAKTVSRKKVTNVSTKKIVEDPIVNEKNEILFDGDKELEKVLEKVSTSEFELDLSDAAKDGLNELKTMSDVDELSIQEDTNKMLEVANEKLKKLDAIEEKLKENINNKSSELKKRGIDFTSFWGGVSDGWH